MITNCAEVHVEFDTDDLAEKYSGVTVSIVRMTPALAEEFLKGNTYNRPVNGAHVRHLRQVLEARDMVMNGEAIIRSPEGTILNGQHRLIACVASGIPFDVMVVDGIDIDAFRTIDGGMKRRASDSLAMDGEPNAKRVASAIQSLIHYVDSGFRVTSGGGSCRKATPSLAARVLAAHPQIRESVAAMSRSKLYENQQGFLLHYLFSRVNRGIADDFARVLAEGDEDLGRPFVVFREVLVLHRHRSHVRSSHAAKAIKAFNAELSGHRPKMLKFLDSEGFPAVSGLDCEALKESI